jgi:hypothetical protein
MPLLFRKAAAFVIQVSSVSASLRQGIRIVSSQSKLGSLMLVPVRE